MNKFIVGIVVATIIIVFGGVYFLSQKPQPQVQGVSEAENLEYYWGNGCPHCAIVEEFMNSWEKRDEVKIDKFEVWYNKVNEARFKQRVATCDIPPNKAGVPLLYTLNGECIVGDTPIIDFLKNNY